MSTNFNKVQTFMSVAGQTEKTRDLKSQIVAFRKNLIDEEVNELGAALGASDFHETVDALADILFVCYGFFETLGVDGDLMFHEVFQSNMSKFCDTEDQAQRTVDHYKNMSSTPYDSPTYEKRGLKWIVFNRSTGKILKNIDWSPPKFEIN